MVQWCIPGPPRQLLGALAVEGQADTQRARTGAVGQTAIVIAAARAQARGDTIWLIEATAMPESPDA